MDIIEIKGKINTAICYARVVEDEAIEQIRRMCDYPMTEGSRIRIMPDVHSGKGCTIGTTMTITDQENILRTTFTMLKSARLLQDEAERKWLRLFWREPGWLAEKPSIQFIIILIQMK